MKFGVAFASAWPFNDAASALELAVATEDAGFESLWTVEHVLWPESYDSVYPYSRSGRMHGEATVSIPDPLIWLSWVGARTSRIRLGTGILVLPQRNPLVVAKALATLDDFSGGRVEAGVGVGWLREEFEALGVPFGDRGRRTDEYIAAMRTVWSDDNASFSGEFVDFEGANVNPKPVQRSIPVTIGGHTPASARRAGRLGDGFYPGRADLEELSALFTVVRETAIDNGRDPDSIVLSAAHPQGVLEDTESRLAVLADLGVTRVVVPAFLLARPDLETGMGRMAELIEMFA
jgi:probable F420-dependent oxidoreductase